jgi:hypothetical protein
VPPKLKVLRAYPHRFGEGKVHMALKEGPGYYVALCTRKVMHAEVKDGTWQDVTCLRCRRAS